MVGQEAAALERQDQLGQGVLRQLLQMRRRSDQHVHVAALSTASAVGPTDDEFGFWGDAVQVD